MGDRKRIRAGLRAEHQLRGPGQTSVTEGAYLAEGLLLWFTVGRPNLSPMELVRNVGDPMRSERLVNVRPRAESYLRAMYPHADSLPKSDYWAVVRTLAVLDFLKRNPRDFSGLPEFLETGRMHGVEGEFLAGGAPFRDAKNRDELQRAWVKSARKELGQAALHVAQKLQGLRVEPLKAALRELIVSDPRTASHVRVELDDLASSRPGDMEIIEEELREQHHLDAGKLPAARQMVLCHLALLISADLDDHFGGLATVEAFAERTLHEALPMPAREPLPHTAGY